MWDDELLKTYQRKYYDRMDSYIRNAVKESIESLIGSCEVQIATDASGQKEIKVTSQTTPSVKGQPVLDEVGFNSSR